jgi:parallel beta-helix repeat protein
VAARSGTGESLYAQRDSTRRYAATFLALGLALLVAGPAAYAAPQAPPAPPEAAAQPKPPGLAPVTQADAQRQATLVDQEDQRIMQTRAVLTAILEIGGQAAIKWKRPQIFDSAHGKTLVLPSRDSGAPYTVTDLERYGGRYFRRLPDGSYLLGAHVFVADGAKVALRSTTAPLTIRMGSVRGAFSSIVSFGGSVSIAGTAQRPVRITSWDAQAGTPDTRVADGRAYIRAVGGDFHLNHARVSHLGFWSGRTGGIALTGTDRPESAVKHQNKAQRNAAKRRRLAARGNGQPGGGPGDVEIDPAGPKGPGGTASHVPAANLVTGSIKNTTIFGDAYGMFVSGSNQTQIVGNRVENSLVHGVLMHRFAKNANIQSTRVTGSRGDGFVLSRATEKVRITGCTAERNGGNGFTLNGQALADGPSASGESLDSFGDSSVNNSVATGNGHYGIELLGGNKLAVQSSKIIGSDMGIVVRARANQVQISGNQLSGQVRQGIALREGVSEAYVAGNTISGARTGIYLRGASGRLVGNVVRAATEHGISLRGGLGTTTVTNNTLGGYGTSAVSASGSYGTVERDDNAVDGWRDTSSLTTKVLRYAKPMNVIWAFVFMLVLFSMLRSRGAGMRKIRRGTHPYADKVLPQGRLWALGRMAAVLAPGPAAPGPAAPGHAAVGTVAVGTAAPGPNGHMNGPAARPAMPAGNGRAQPGRGRRRRRQGVS